MQDLRRLLSAQSIAVIGGGAWCEGIIGAARRIGYQGEIFPVHPSGKEIAGLPALRSLSDRDGPIDAAFVGVNRRATIEVVSELSRLGAGGCTCFASGFAEAAAEDGDARDLQAQLVAAAGEMPLLGPNCYGFVNALDQVAIWPDQHGMQPVARGVAILTQSSNIAINMTMQRRALPIAYMITCGNQAQTSQADIALSLLEDSRVTALGLHIEGFGDVARWYEVAHKAAARGVPVVAIKVGTSEQAQAAAVSHTASMAGSDAGASALLRHLGFGRATDLATFLEALKLLHCVGPLENAALSSISCSGGEASLMADSVTGRAVHFPPLEAEQKQALSTALGPMVALANPLDYHTYIWRDIDAITAAWTPMAAPHIGLTMSVVDYPHTDHSDWVCATQAALNVREATGRPFAMVASLPELMPEDVAATLMAGGVVPMHGMREAIAAVEICATLGCVSDAAPLPGGVLAATEVLTEAEAKFALSETGLDLPRRATGSADALFLAAQSLMPPLALKGLGVAHKTEAGAVALHLALEDLEPAAEAMPTDAFLVEEMVSDGVAELLIGVTRDPAHGLIMTLGAGGIFTEVWQDTQSILLPASTTQVEAALDRLKVAKLLQGFRGKPAASRPAILAAIAAVQAYAIKHHARLAEIEINPLICTPTRAVAVDAMIRREI